MRTQRKVKYQLKQVIYRHLQKRLRVNFKKTAVGCSHNRETPLGDGFVRLCGVMSAEGCPRNLPCDERLDQNQTARDCPLWEPLQTRGEVKAGFQEILGSDRGVIASHFPDVAALMWVLDDDDDVLPSDDDVLPSDDDLDAVMEVVTPQEDEPSTWWDRIKKLKLKLGGGA